MEIDVDLQETNEIKVKIWGWCGKKLSVELVKEVEAQAAAVCGPSGCHITDNEPQSDLNGTEFYAPQGALTEYHLISITGTREFIPETTNEEVIIELEPKGLEFELPVQITVPYDVSLVGSNQNISSLLYSVSNEPEDLISEVSIVKPLEVSIVDNSLIRLTLDHFSRLFVFRVDKVYIVLDIPSKFLTKSDIIYALSDSTSFDWFPGHTALFLGEGEYEENTIIESTPYDPPQCGGLPAAPDCKGVILSDWDTFSQVYYHIYMGARKPLGVTSDIRIDATDFAISKIDYKWEAVGSRPGGDGFSCVGLIEAAYESAGLNIVRFPEIFGLLPIQQFNRTNPVDEIIAFVGEKMIIPVRGVIDLDPGSDEDYDDDPSNYTITAVDLPPRANFTNNAFSWTPTCDDLDESYRIRFEVESNIENTSVHQDLTITVSQKDSDNDGYFTCDAGLIDNGDGTITQIRNDGSRRMWLRDGNYARTSGYHPDGRMTWDQAMAWIDYLNSINHLGYNNWRLPVALPIDPASGYNYDVDCNGSTDKGYNITSPNSEMSYMYYVELGNLGYHAPDPNCLSYPQPNWGLSNTEYFINLMNTGHTPGDPRGDAAAYWTGTTVPTIVNDAFDFRFKYGDQSAHHKHYYNYAWAVRDM